MSNAYVAQPGIVVALPVLVYLPKAASAVSAISMASEQNNPLEALPPRRGLPAIPRFVPGNSNKCTTGALQTSEPNAATWRGRARPWKRPMQFIRRRSPLVTARCRRHLQ